MGTAADDLGEPGGARRYDETPRLTDHDRPSEARPTRRPRPDAAPAARRRPPRPLPGEPGAATARPSTGSTCGRC